MNVRASSAGTSETRGLTRFWAPRWKFIGNWAAAMRIELKSRCVPFRREIELPLDYKGQRLATSYRADFGCFDTVIVELKAPSKLGEVEEAQVINYLKATGFGLCEI